MFQYLFLHSLKNLEIILCLPQKDSQLHTNHLMPDKLGANTFCKRTENTVSRDHSRVSIPVFTISLKKLKIILCLPHKDSQLHTNHLRPHKLGT